MCLAQGPQRSDAGEAQTRRPSVSSQALYHWATALPVQHIYYNDIRQQHLPKNLCNSKSLFDFYNILGQSDCNVIWQISNFIICMLKKEIVSQYVKSAKPIWLHLPKKDTLPF